MGYCRSRVTVGTVAAGQRLIPYTHISSDVIMGGARGTVSAVVSAVVAPVEGERGCMLPVRRNLRYGMSVCAAESRAPHLDMILETQLCVTPICRAMCEIL